MRKTAYLLIILLALAASSSVAYAGTGGIRIDPHSSYYPQPISLTSPATFNVSTTNGNSYDPHLLLVMTDAAYQGLSGNVVVNWTGGSISIPKGSFIIASGQKIPPGTTNGADYTVASLRDHIGSTGTLWYAFEPILNGPLSESGDLFTITLTSTNLRMLVYVLGKSSLTATLFDMKVPPTQPGLVVPEPSILLAIVGSFGALALYAVKRRKP
jgi:hypothetical protein